MSDLPAVEAIEDLPETVEDKPAEPTPIESAAQFRKFIRSYMNSTEGKLRVKLAMESNDKILGQAMVIAAGNFTEEGATPGGGLSTVNFVFVENVLQMGPEAMRRYAETGELQAGPPRAIQLTSTTETPGGATQTWTAAEPSEPVPAGGDNQGH